MLLPIPLMRGISLFTVVSMYVTFSCAGPRSGDGEMLGLFGTRSNPGNGNAYGPRGNPGGGGENGGRYKAGVLGSYFYVSTTNGSTDVVTDGSGKVLARFYANPYGRVNYDLTELDTDGDGKEYELPFLFTGQEYDPETDLYNYNARIYDPDSGRFMQPDAVHSEISGMDSYDRYQYAAANPVNLTDSSGNSWVNERLKSGKHKYPLQSFIHKFNNFVKNAGHDFSKLIYGSDHHNCRRVDSACGFAKKAGGMYLGVAQLDVNFYKDLYEFLRDPKGEWEHGKIGRWGAKTYGPNRAWEPPYLVQLAFEMFLASCRSGAVDAKTCAFGVLYVGNYAKEQRNKRRRERWGDFGRVTFLREERWKGLNLSVSSNSQGELYCTALIAREFQSPGPAVQVGSRIVTTAEVAVMACAGIISKAMDRH